MFDLLIAKVTIVLLLRYLDSYVRQRLPLPMDPIQILMFGLSPGLNSNFSNLRVLYTAVSKTTYIVFCIHYLNF